MKRLDIELTTEQRHQLRPIERALEEQHGKRPVSTIGQVMFYEDRAVLVIGVLSADLTEKVQAVTMSASEESRLLDLPVVDDTD
jgi:hypothetical protein